MSDCLGDFGGSSNVPTESEIRRVGGRDLTKVTGVQGLSGVTVRRESPGSEDCVRSRYDKCRQDPKSGWDDGTDGITRDPKTVGM